MAWVEIVTAPASALMASVLAATTLTSVAWLTWAPSVMAAVVSATTSFHEASAETAMPNLPVPAPLEPDCVLLSPAAGASVCALLLVAMAPATA